MRQLCISEAQNAKIEPHFIGQYFKLLLNAELLANTIIYGMFTLSVKDFAKKAILSSRMHTACLLIVPGERRCFDLVHGHPLGVGQTDD